MTPYEKRIENKAKEIINACWSQGFSLGETEQIAQAIINAIQAEISNPEWKRST